MSNLDVALRLRLINGLSGPAKVAAKDIQALAGSSGALSRARGGEQLAKDIDRAGMASRKVRRDVLDLGREAAGLKGGGELTRGLSRAGSAARAAKRDLVDLGREAAGLTGGERLARDLNQATAAAKRLRRELGAQRRQAERADSGVARPEHHGPTSAKADESAVLALGRRAVATAGGYYAVRGLVRKTIGEAITFEQSMAELRKKVNDAPAGGLAQLEKAIKQIALDLGMSQEKVAQLAAGAAAGGIAFADLERFTRNAAKAANSFDMTPEEASGKLAGIKAGTGMTIAQMEVLLDKFNGLGDNSNALEREIVEMFGRAGAAAKAAGIDFDTSLAFLTALRSAGMQEDVAARFFTALTGRLATGGAGGRGAKDLGEGLKMLGLSLETVSAGLKSNPAGTLLDLLDRLNKAPDPAKAGQKIAGGEWWDELARLAQARAEVEKQLTFLSEPKNYQGSLQRNLDIKLQTTASHLERLKVLSAEVGDSFGRWALPPINNAIEQWITAAEERKKQAGLLERWKAEREAADPGADERLKTARAEEDARSRDANMRMFGDERGVAGLVQNWLFGRRVTTDPMRGVASDATQQDKDLRTVSEKKRAEAALLAERAKGATGEDQERLGARARALDVEAEDDLRGAALERGRAGRAAARDVTGVEAGEDLARATVEGLRQRAARAKAPVEELRRTIEQMEKQLAQPRVPDRDGLVLRLEIAKKKLHELTGEATKAGETTGENIAAGLRATAPKVDAEARSIWERVKDLFSGGIDVPIRLKPEGASFGGREGASVQKTSLSGDETFAGRRFAAPESGGLGRSGVGGAAGARTGRSRTAALPGPSVSSEGSTGRPSSMLDLIARAEGTAGRGDYNTVLGYGRYGRPSKPLTDMTLDEVYRFGRGVRARHGASSAVGRYQIVGRTMKGLSRELGLDMNTTRYTPEIQDRMAAHLLRRRGRSVSGLRNEWEGLRRVPERTILDTYSKGIRSSAPPAPSTPAAPTPSPGRGGPLMQEARLAPRKGGRSSGIQIAAVHVHGVRDLEGIQRQVQRAADRRARRTRDDALHDVGDTA